MEIGNIIGIGKVNMDGIFNIYIVIIVVGLLIGLIVDVLGNDINVFDIILFINKLKLLLYNISIIIF